MKRARILIAVATTTTLGLLLLLTVGAQTPEPVDSAAIDKIKAAGKVTPQVMEMATYITNTYGMRLTNSANVKAAGEYARKKLVEWKLTGVEVQPFTFGNGWANDRFSVKLANEPAVTFQAYSKPWTQGTNGPITGEVVEGVRTQADLTSMKGKLKGKFVLVLPPQAPGPSGAAPPVKRFTDAELAAMSTGAPTATPAAGAAAPGAAPEGPVSRGQAGNRGAAAPAPEPPAEEAGAFAFLENALSAAPAVATNAAPTTRGASPTAAMPSRAVVTRFYFDEGVAAMIEPTQTRFGAMFSLLDTGETSAWRKEPKSVNFPTKTPPQIVMAVDDYNKLVEKVQKSSPVSLTADIKNTYQTVDQNGFNLVGDIKGTDKADELVVLGAQLDTVNLGKGATDNAAGVAVVMEAVRLLKAANLPMRRTVRIGLWTAGEQGALGSMAFVDKHFFLRSIRQLKPGHAKLNAYFNMNGGTGAIRGVFLQGNTQLKPVFETWLGPFKSMGMTTLADRNSPIVSDHISFDNIGLPGFMFIQDPIQYDAVTRHSTLDTVDKLIKEDLEKNAAIVAGWVYLAANRAEMLPRKPLPRGVYAAGRTGAMKSKGTAERCKDVLYRGLRASRLPPAILLAPLCGALFVQVPGGTITGTVKATNGTPAAGVRVAARPKPDSLAEVGKAIAMSSIAQTDANGRYRLENVPPGRYHIAAGNLDVPTYYPGTLDITNSKEVQVTSGAALTTIDFTLADLSNSLAGLGTGLVAAGGYRIPIQVQVEGGGKVPVFSPNGLAMVALVHPGDISGFTEPLNSSMIVVPIPLTPTDYSARILNVPEGYTVKSLTYGTRNLLTDVLQLSMAQPNTLRSTQASLPLVGNNVLALLNILPTTGGAVTSPTTLSVVLAPAPVPPVSGVRVTGRTPGSRSIWLGNAPGFLYADGSFELRGVPAGRHVILASNDTGAQAQAMGATLVVGDRDIDGIQLDPVPLMPREMPATATTSHSPGTKIPLAIVKGRVVSATTQQPLRGVLSIIGLTTQISYPIDADGRFELPKLLPGSYNLTASIFDYFTVNQTLIVGETDVPLELRAEPAF